MTVGSKNHQITTEAYICKTQISSSLNIAEAAKVTSANVFFDKWEAIVVNKI